MAGEPAEGHGVRPGPPVLPAHAALAHSCYTFFLCTSGTQASSVLYIIILIIFECMTTRKVVHIDWVIFCEPIEPCGVTRHCELYCVLEIGDFYYLILGQMDVYQCSPPFLFTWI